MHICICMYVQTVHNLLHISVATRGLIYISKMICGYQNGREIRQICLCMSLYIISLQGVYWLFLWLNIQSLTYQCSIFVRKETIISVSLEVWSCQYTMGSSRMSNWHVVNVMAERVANSNYWLEALETQLVLIVVRVVIFVGQNSVIK